MAPDPADAPEPLGVEAAPVQPALTDAEAVICSVPWPCATALRIARCESGADYWADPADNPSHRGAFQLSYVHAERFTAHGWDWNTDGLVLERNVAIAYEVYKDSGWRPWSCA